VGAWDAADPGLDGAAATSVQLLQHVYERPGTYFPGVRVTSHRRGDVRATSGRIANLARARVVVS
jgi:hypothetical protein